MERWTVGKAKNGWYEIRKNGTPMGKYPTKSEATLHMMSRKAQSKHLRGIPRTKEEKAAYYKVHS